MYTDTGCEFSSIAAITISCHSTLIAEFHTIQQLINLSCGCFGVVEHSCGASDMLRHFMIYAGLIISLILMLSL